MSFVPVGSGQLYQLIPQQPQERFPHPQMDHSSNFNICPPSINNNITTNSDDNNNNNIVFVKVEPNTSDTDKSINNINNNNNQANFEKLKNLGIPTPTSATTSSTTIPSITSMDDSFNQFTPILNKNIYHLQQHNSKSSNISPTPYNFTTNSMYNAQQASQVAPETGASSDSLIPSPSPSSHSLESSSGNVLSSPMSNNSRGILSSPTEFNSNFANNNIISAEPQVGAKPPKPKPNRSPSSIAKRREQHREHERQRRLKQKQMLQTASEIREENANLLLRMTHLKNELTILQNNYSQIAFNYDELVKNYNVMATENNNLKKEISQYKYFTPASVGGLPAMTQHSINTNTGGQPMLPQQQLQHQQHIPPILQQQHQQQQLQQTQQQLQQQQHHQQQQHMYPNMAPISTYAAQSNTQSHLIHQPSIMKKEAAHPQMPTNFSIGGHHQQQNPHSGS
ncbi:hypothetical protein SAMD00019534_052880 [Acytostelium subglobosum LB1]|uniref:hypothetical protein n=1 Tax=Acytostelium subglobosum LB1 TaxID=1410327 RepID=UPI00064521E0|nr:hypothetical protein SAMD00019534_052880 [Acytostelium subglobosum LB1]GAM22113.1 hypothetical protein SAMD00019534_052880 [Acytostelium subglobosum LB1]|eukprot:XP_012755213.1 hypothetical protein SAMD00019534_052880 [Acytostelium subglobosum LB1]